MSLRPVLRAAWPFPGPPWFRAPGSCRLLTLLPSSSSPGSVLTGRALLSKRSELLKRLGQLTVEPLGESSQAERLLRPGPRTGTPNPPLPAALLRPVSALNPAMLGLA